MRFLIDTGHVTAWGGDVLELLPFAAHVQLRDARPGEAQVAPGEGDVDFAAILERLEALGYDGKLSVEYFDLPEYGWPCDDVRGVRRRPARPRREWFLIFRSDPSTTGRVMVCPRSGRPRR